MSLRVVVVGRGKVGRVLQRALHAAGIASTLLPGRGKPRSLDVDVVLFAVPDAQIARVAEAWAPRLPARAVALHVAGARGVDELAALAPRAVGVMHPLVSFADALAASLAGTTFTTYGDKRAVASARRLARALGAHALVLPAAPGPAYHAAAALLANGAVALSFVGVQTLAALGIAPRRAEQALAGLLASVAQNVERLGVPRALTGPVSRGDAAAVRAHLVALAALDAGLARHYAALQPAVLETARAQGLDGKRAAAVRRALARR